MKRIFAALLITGCLALALASGAPTASAANEPVTLVGGTMLPEGHVYWQACVKFKELLEKYYTGGPLTVELHHSSVLGTEKDSIEYMIQGTAVDFYIISPAWFATWNKVMPIIDAPFLFKSTAHWEKCIESGVLKPLDDDAIKTGVRFLGHGGGGVRSIISNKPAKSIADFPGIRMRVQGSPLHQRAFAATGLVATPMDYMEVYNAIKTGVLDALENEPAGLEGMKFYEVAPYYILTNHQITTRQLGFSEPRFQSLPKDLQEAILKAGREASAHHRKIEVADSERIIRELTEKHGLKPLAFDNTEMRRLASPVIEEFAKEIGALEIYRAIEAVN
ncbi:MAG: TRAP transporter substrate-binding protein [Planctomycetota bacterium]|jgi:TRAP-type C4-dicarboxylate transport system substrate-binding protein|nr:TRAP transporter substrate-binding protein [Planctomycetota bacterium]